MEATPMTTSYQAAHILIQPILAELNGHISTRKGALKLSRVQMYLLDQHWKEVTV
jgi:hypothetical protein